MLHRPGIASVSGDMLVLGATTIDEIKRCHAAATVRLAVDATNAAEAQLRHADTRAAAQDAAEWRSIRSTSATSPAKSPFDDG